MERMGVDWFSLYKKDEYEELLDELFLSHLENVLMVEGFVNNITVKYGFNLVKCLKNPTVFFNQQDEYPSYNILRGKTINKKEALMESLKSVGFDPEDINVDKFVEFAQNLVLKYGY